MKILLKGEEKYTKHAYKDKNSISTTILQPKERKTVSIMKKNPK